MPYTHQGKIIREGRGWVDANGVKHPTNWASWSDEEKTAKGLVWQEPPAPYDSRFWWDAETPKALDTLKPEWVARVKDIANSKMATTDWVFIRQEEQGSKLPRRIATYRQLTRQASNDIETQLLAAETHEAFVQIATGMEWPPEPADLTEEHLATRLPLPNWVVRTVLGTTRVAVVDGYIASLPDTAETRALKERWEKGPIFHYEHEDTQGIVQVIQSQEPTFDAEAAWSEGEALRYEDDV